MKDIKTSARRKRNLIIAALALFFSAEIFSMGIGPQLDFSAGTDGSEGIFQAGISCTMKADNFPLVVSVATDYDFSENSLNAGISGDYWIFNPQIGKYSSFFAGPGVFAGGSFGGTEESGALFCVGPRFVLGLNWIFYDGFLEYFVQAALQPEWKTGKSTDFNFKVPCNAGIRLYF